LITATLILGEALFCITHDDVIIFYII
jgi:hypothetical protein